MLYLSSLYFTYFHTYRKFFFSHKKCHKFLTKMKTNFWFRSPIQYELMALKCTINHYTDWRIRKIFSVGTIWYKKVDVKVITSIAIRVLINRLQFFSTYKIDVRCEMWDVKNLEKIFEPFLRKTTIRKSWKQVSTIPYHMSI